MHYMVKDPIERVEIAEIHNDPSGPDKEHGEPTQLEREWVEIRNSSSTDVSMGGWTLEDTAGHEFTFDEEYVLPAGESVKVHTGSGTDSQSDRYWGRDAYVWNNEGDTATLRSRTPVVLVHGILSGPSIWGDADQGLLDWDGEGLVDRLEDEGIPRDRVDYEEETLDDITALSDEVADAVDGRTVDIVAHSMGGLLARHYIENRDGDEHVRNLVMLGTPNSGSWMADALGGLATCADDLVLPTSVNQMQSGSDFLRSLDDSPPEDVDYTTVAGTQANYSEWLEELGETVGWLEDWVVDGSLGWLPDLGVVGHPVNVLQFPNHLADAVVDLIEGSLSGWPPGWIESVWTEYVPGAQGDGVVSVESVAVGGGSPDVTVPAYHTELYANGEALDAVMEQVTESEAVRATV